MSTPVSNTPPATTPTAGSSNTTQATQGLNSNYQDFLKLLTTQLQNQDPTAPADTNQITQEIASLSQVEQQINTNTSLQQLVSLFSATQLNNAVSYIGKEVMADGSQGSLVNGQANFTYNLPSAAQSTTVTIKDASGNTVFSGAGTTLAGDNQVFWNGINSTSKQTMPDGTYSISVTAVDATGNSITPTTRTSGIVQSVDMQNGVAVLSLGGGLTIPLTQVQSVSDALVANLPTPVTTPTPTPAPASTTPTPTPTGT